MGRPRGSGRKGCLELRGKGIWWARLTVTIEGESVRRWFNTGKTSKAAANAVVKRLIRENATAPTIEAVAVEAQREETLQEAWTRIVKQQRDDGLKTWKERLSRLDRQAGPVIGAQTASSVGVTEIEEALIAARDAELSEQSVIHLRNDMSTVFGSLEHDGFIEQGKNPMDLVRLPKRLKRDKRPRIQLHDDEFARFVTCPVVPEPLMLKALSSRTYGGQRTSDLHAWGWEHFDLLTWISAKVFRPKTQGDITEAVDAELVEMVLPDPLRTLLYGYWERLGRPSSGPVFPRLKGAQAGERHGKRSHARELRYYLWRAGVHRPREGFDLAMRRLQAAEAELARLRAEGAKGEVRAAQRRVQGALVEAQKLDDIQTDGPNTRRADFHSFRRSFASALAAADVAEQRAMVLAGHRDPKTHKRYVDLMQAGVTIEMPVDALPEVSFPGFRPLSLPKLPVTLRAANDDPAELSSDPTGNRTRVTGVRGEGGEHKPAENMLDPFPADPDAEHKNTGRNETRGLNELPITQIAWDLALSAALRAKAGEIAEVLS